MIISDGEGTQAMIQRGYRSFLYILNALSYNRRVPGEGWRGPFRGAYDRLLQSWTRSQIPPWPAILKLSA
jgi:hypothetical protein